jgi:O-methyltransferase involved in polyketide biosynthesis
MEGREEMDLKFGDIQETALIPLAIKASETARPNARIKDIKAKEIIDTLGVDVSKFDPFLSHEGVVARTIMYREELKRLISKYPEALCINLGCGFDDKFSQVDNGRSHGLMWICPIRSLSDARYMKTGNAAPCLTEVLLMGNGQRIFRKVT